MNIGHIDNPYAIPGDRSAREAVQKQIPVQGSVPGTQFPTETRDGAQNKAVIRQPLTDEERTTLHMLFGGARPEELNFYGKNNVKQIFKGCLLDVKG